MNSPTPASMNSGSTSLSVSALIPTIIVEREKNACMPFISGMSSVIIRFSKGLSSMMPRASSPLFATRLSTPKPSKISYQNGLLKLAVIHNQSSHSALESGSIKVVVSKLHCYSGDEQLVSEFGVWNQT